MRIILSQNIQDISLEMEAQRGELSTRQQIENFQKTLQAAYESAEAVWKIHPEFKTVCLDTLSKEESDFIKESDKKPKN